MTPGRHASRTVWLTVVLVIALVAAAVLSMGVGVSRQSPSQVLSALSDGARSLVTGSHYPADETHTIVLDLRLPRLLLAILVGVCLAVSGAVMQAVFQNSLAEPYILGVSSGAAFGAMVSIAIASTAVASILSLPVLAFAGGLAVVFLVYALAQRGGRVQTGTLLLTGIAIGSLVSATTSFLMMVRNEDLRTVLFWLLGGLSGRGWDDLKMILPAAIVGVVCAMVAVRPLNLLLLGDETAASLGLNLQLSKRLLLTLASLLAATAVAVSGIVAFVGLVVPHVTRLLVGPDHRRLIPLAALLGALLMVLADTAARTILMPAELPIGIITSALGCPFFLYLLRVHGRRGL